MSVEARPDDDLDDWFEKAQAEGIARARALREQARQGGLRFEAYLPPDLADWLLGLVEAGVFTDPSEAVFVICGEHRDLAAHAHLRRELLDRVLQAAIEDPRPGVPAEKVSRSCATSSRGRFQNQRSGNELDAIGCAHAVYFQGFSTATSQRSKARTSRVTTVSP